MKKITLFALLAVVLATFSGCTKEYITYGAQVSTHEYTITPAQWTRNQGANEYDADNYLYATFENKDINRYVVHNGTVTADVYLLYDAQNNKWSWRPLPYVYPFEVQVTDAEGNVSYTFVPRNLRMEWEEGIVTFIIQDLDGYDPTALNSTITIRVTVINNM